MHQQQQQGCAVYVISLVSLIAALLIAAMVFGVLTGIFIRIVDAIRVL